MSAKKLHQVAECRGGPGSALQVGGTPHRLEECPERDGLFLGGALVTLLGFQGAVLVMALALALVWCVSMLTLKRDLGKAKNKPKFSEIFSKSRAINYLSAVCLFLFGARDVWFVVVLPVYLASSFGWDHWYVGDSGALDHCLWRGSRPRRPALPASEEGRVPDDKAAMRWALVLALTRP